MLYLMLRLHLRLGLKHRTPLPFPPSPPLLFSLPLLSPSSPPVCKEYIHSSSENSPFQTVLG